MSHKRPKQKKKEQKKQTQASKNLLKRRSIYYQLFEIIEIENEIKDLPISIKNDIYNFSWPKIKIDYSKIELNFGKELEKKIKQELDKQTIQINGKFVFVSAISYLIGLKELISSWYERISSLKLENLRDNKKENFNLIYNKLNYINSKLLPLVNSLYEDYIRAISNVACKHINANFDFENGIYPKLSFGKTETGKIFPVIEIHQLKLNKEKLRISSQERNGYRCHCVSLFGIKPISFNENVIENTKKIPVYIQDHAIIRLKERINIKPAGYVLDCLGRSLSDPIVTDFDRESYLVEFRLYDYKLGYLVISRTEDFALVRSFKFITMTGTPEFRKLTNRLRATKHDFTYLGLDTMEIFVNSDINKDEKLKNIFKECGLGHLFELSDLFVHDSIGFTSSKKNVAEEINKYFNF